MLAPLLAQDSAAVATATINVGETAILTSPDNGNANLLVAQNIALSQQGTIQSLSFYVATAAGNLRLGIYDAAGPSGGPGALKAQTASFVPTVGWNTQPVQAPAMLPAGTYWIAYLPSSDGLAFRKSVTAGISGKFYTFAFASLPATFSTTPQSTTSHFSFYGTFTIGPVVPDIIAPTSVTGFTATAISSSQISLAWTASTDNVGVAGYRLFRDGATIGTTAGLSLLDGGLAAGSTHLYDIEAFDAAGNISMRLAGGGVIRTVPVLDGQMARPSYNTGVGFFIGPDNKLYDANGRAFRIRGVNRVHYDSGDGTGRAIANTHANTTRFTLYWPNGTTPAQFVTQMTTEYFNKSIVVMPGQWTNTTGHTVTCSGSATDLSTTVDDWVNQAAVWNTIERWSMINIANEWGTDHTDPDGGTVWRDSYITAISRMRAAGYLGTLVIDSGGCGQDYEDLINYGQAVFNSDAQKNILFSIHIYNNTQAGQAVSKLATLTATGLPFIIGEFGPGRNIGPAPTNLTPGELIQAAEAAGVGWLAWAWDDNDLSGGLSDDNWFAMTYNNGTGYITANPADLTTFGQDVVLNATYGLQRLATPATIF